MRPSACQNPPAGSVMVSFLSAVCKRGFYWVFYLSSMFVSHLWRFCSPPESPTVIGCGEGGGLTPHDS